MCLIYNPLYVLVRKQKRLRLRAVVAGRVFLPDDDVMDDLRVARPRDRAAEPQVARGDEVAVDVAVVHRAGSRHDEIRDYGAEREFLRR